MKRKLSAARKAYRLLKSDSRAETVAAVGLLAVTFGPVVYRWFKRRSR